MARLYANENFPLPVVESLRQLGHEVLTIQEAGKSDQAMPDREVLAFAASHGMALVTLNRKHFIRLHAEQPDHEEIMGDGLLRVQSHHTLYGVTPGWTVGACGGFPYIHSAYTSLGFKGATHRSTSLWLAEAMT